MVSLATLMDFGELSMKKLCFACFLFLLISNLWSEKRFDRPLIKVSDPKTYQFHKLDDVEYPTLSNARYEVSCIVYRGTQYYYVEITIKNNSVIPLPIPTSFVTFSKPGYTTYRTDSMQAARQLAAAGGVRFIPTPAPYVPPTYHTTVDATATTYGNETNISGTATTTTDNSGQAGAELGNAIGNAIAARRFLKAQRDAVALSAFLESNSQTDEDMPLPPGQSRTIVATFTEVKQKKKPFSIDIDLGGDAFHFAYKE